MRRFRYLGKLGEFVQGLRGSKYPFFKTKTYWNWWLFKKKFNLVNHNDFTFFVAAPSQKPVRQMEKNTKLDRVLLLITVQHLAHVWKKIELDALVYVNQHQSSVKKESKKERTI